MSVSSLYQAYLYPFPHSSSSSDSTPYTDLLVEEHPLSLFIHRKPYATFLRTPGHDLDLIKGFLWTEGIIEDEDDLQFIHPCSLNPLNRIDVTLESGVALPNSSRSRPITSSCGLCALDEWSPSSQHPLALNNQQRCSTPLLLSERQLNSLYHQLNRSLTLFKQTGGAHGAILFDHTLRIHAVREDIGRHNALDQILGVLLSLKDRYIDHQWGVILSSRAGYELVSKSLRAKLSALVCLGASSGLAHRAALQANLPLYSFIRPSRGHFHGINLPCSSLHHNLDFEEESPS